MVCSRYGFGQIKLCILLLMVLFLPAAGIAGFSGYAPEDGHLAVHFIDVGQGDAIFIQTESHNLLIDGGDRGNTVPKYLQSRGVNDIHIMIGTHPHADHIGGLINVMQEMEVLEVIDPAVVHTTRTFEEYLTLIDQQDIRFTEGRAGMVREIGEGKDISILHPEDPHHMHLNDASIVARVSYGEVSFLFTGDAEEAAEREILDRSKQALRSTILKVGHHGSRTSTTPAFLEAVDPEIAVILCGAGNRYGHPHEETLYHLTSRGIEIYRTDIHGNIVISTDGRNYHIHGHDPLGYEGGEVSPVRVDINSADIDRLQEIIHISERRAQELITLRPFDTLDQLTRITGIGPARLQDIKDQGLAHVKKK